MGIIMPDDSLRAAAQEAIKRLELRKDETANDWVNRLAPTFFADLYERQETLGRIVGPDEEGCSPIFAALLYN